MFVYVLIMGVKTIWFVFESIFKTMCCFNYLWIFFVKKRGDQTCKHAGGVQLVSCGGV